MTRRASGHAQHELAKIEKYYAAGGKVDFLDLDGPVGRLSTPRTCATGSAISQWKRQPKKLSIRYAFSTEPTPNMRLWHFDELP